MRTLFISDLHLNADNQEIIELFIDFLNKRAQKAHALYILGDLFEVWLGDDFVTSELIKPINALKKYSDQGHNVYVMHGNRDFLMGTEFERMTGAKLIKDPTVIDLFGVKTLLSHGDAYCVDDTRYQQFRLTVRDPTWQADFLAKPIHERMSFAQLARAESKLQTSAKPMEIMDVNISAVEKTLLHYDVRQVIHGHTHRPNIHHHNTGEHPFVRLVLGDWYEQGSVLECTPDKIALNSFDAKNERSQVVAQVLPN